MRTTKLQLFCVALVTLVSAQVSFAQLVYEFANPQTGAVQSGFNISGVGKTAQFRVYLHDESGGAGTLNSQGGLGSAAVRLTFDTLALSNRIVQVKTLATDATPATPPWDFGTTNGSASNSAVLNLASSFTQGVLLDGSGRVLLGTFTLTGLSAGTQTLTLADPNPATSTDTTVFSGLGLDQQLAPVTATITVTDAIAPEPRLLAPAIAMAFVLQQRRRGLRPIGVPRVGSRSRT